MTCARRDIEQSDGYPMPSFMLACTRVRLRCWRAMMAGDSGLAQRWSRSISATVMRGMDDEWRSATARCLRDYLDGLVTGWVEGRHRAEMATMRKEYPS